MAEPVPLEPTDAELLDSALQALADGPLPADEVARRCGAASVCASSMLEALHGEITRRARHYGMSDDQFMILAMGHRCWRRPFAEDLNDDQFGGSRRAGRPSTGRTSPGLRSV